MGYGRLVLALFIVLGWAISANAAGVTVHAAEIGVAKFHRYDNTQHPYASDNVWANYIAPEGASVESTPIVNQNADKSYTVIFSTLEELVQSLMKISKETQQTIQVFNINGHGAPGVMWYPKDKAAMGSFSCYDWVEAAKGDDVANYNQYYSAVSKEDIMAIRSFSEQLGASIPCTVGLKEWQMMAKKYTELKTIFSEDAIVHFVSCTVGLGKRGDVYTKGMASILYHAPTARIETSIPLGLGDWSMPEGMGFWDYQNDDQLAADNKTYVENKRDRDIMQKGAIRVGYLTAGRGEESAMVADREFMFLDEKGKNDPLVKAQPERATNAPRPNRVRIPGTGVQLPVYYSK